MMNVKDINLLPPEYRKKPQTLRNTLIIVIILLLLFPITKYAFVEPINIKNQKTDLLRSLQSEFIKTTEVDAEYAQDLNMLEDIDQRLMELDEIKAGDPHYWQDVLIALVQSLPDKSSIDSFKCDSSSILVSGTSPNDRVSAQYMRSLKNTGYFSEVYVEKILYKSNDEVNFHIRCNLK